MYSKLETQTITTFTSNFSPFLVFEFRRTLTRQESFKYLNIILYQVQLILQLVLNKIRNQFEL